MTTSPGATTRTTASSGWSMDPIAELGSGSSIDGREAQP